MDGKKKKNKLNLLGVGSLAAFLLLTVIATYLLVTYISGIRHKSESPVAAESTNGQAQEEVEVPWRTYTNEEYGYEVSHPGLLFQREFSDQGGYEHFVRFEETAFSVDKGVAIGVTARSVGEEISNVKSNFENDAQLLDEGTVRVDGKEATYLIFNPTTEGIEGRTAVIFEYEGKVFSISTVPGQINKVVESFKFID